MDLILKEECRNELKKPLGKLVNETGLLKEIRNSEIITVGDKVTQTFLKLGLKPKLSIIDYKIERGSIEYDYKPMFKKILSAKNKDGTISEEAIEKIREALKYENCLLEIDGEEDLLTLIVISELENKLETVVCYGQPGEGIVVVEINKEKKKEVKNLLEKCFTN